MLTWRGTEYPEVPDDAFVLTQRAYAVLLAAATTYPLVNDVVPASAASYLFNGPDVTAFLGTGRRWTGRMIGFGIAAHPQTTADERYIQQVTFNVQRDDLDTAGAVIAGTSVSLGHYIKAAAAAAGDRRQLDAWAFSGGPTLPQPLRAPYVSKLEIGDRHRITGGVVTAAAVAFAVPVSVFATLELAVWELEDETTPVRP